MGILNIQTEKVKHSQLYPINRLLLNMNGYSFARVRMDIFTVKKKMFFDKAF